MVALVLTGQGPQGQTLQQVIQVSLSCQSLIQVIVPPESNYCNDLHPSVFYESIARELQAGSRQMIYIVHQL